MARGKRHTPEQIVNVLRQIEVAMANGKTTPAACKEAGFTEQTYYRWRKEYGGLKVDQAKRLKELEQENAKLKRLVAELSLDKQILQDIARGKLLSPSVGAPLWSMHGRAERVSDMRAAWFTSRVVRNATSPHSGTTKTH